jgi:hypothetical protein
MSDAIARKDFIVVCSSIGEPGYDNVAEVEIPSLAA